jgi:hypothetical protein
LRADVVVAARQQVAEDELGDVHILRLVHLHRDTPAVVVDADRALLSVDLDPQLCSWSRGESRGKSRGESRGESRDKKGGEDTGESRG